MTDEKIKPHVTCKDEWLSSSYVKFNNYNHFTKISDWNEGLPSCPNFLKLQTWCPVSDLSSSDRYAVDKLAKHACGVDTMLNLNKTYTSYYYNTSSGVDGWQHEITIKVLFMYNRVNNEFVEIRQTDY